MRRRRYVIDSIAAAIVGIERPHPTRVAIDGVDAAGKTVLADELGVAVSALGRAVIRASVDGFHNPAAVRYRRGEDSAEGYWLDSFDYGALVDELLVPLGPGKNRVYRRAAFDFRTGSAVGVDGEVAPADAILLLDGVFLLRPELRAHWDFSVFVDASFEVTLERARSRDAALFGSVEAVERRYATRYIPGQKLYLEACKPKELATVVVENDDADAPTLRARSAPRSV